MKRKNVWSKVLLLALCLVLALGALTGCGNDEEITALKDAVSDLQTQVNGNASKETVEQLQTLVNQIKTTADAAATLEALTDVTADLALVKTTADAAATADALDAVIADLEALQETAALGTELDEVVADLAAVKATAEAAVTDAELTEAVDAAIDAAVTKLEQTIADGNEELRADIDALSGKIDGLTETVGSNTDAINSIKESLDTANSNLTSLAGRVDALESALDALENDDFATQYYLASKVLMGALDEGTPEYEKYSGYSLVKFDALVATVSSADYDDDTYNLFQSAAERERFYLNRALTVEDIIASFDRVEKLMGELPTLRQMVEYKLNQIDGANENEDGTENSNKIKATPEFAKFLAGITTTFNKLGETDKQALQERYNLVMEAYKNLLAAKDASVAINTQIDALAPVVFGKSEAPIAEARSAADAYVDTYFENDDYNALYDETVTTSYLIHLEALVGYVEELANLTAANGTKPATIELVQNYATTKPLYTDLTALTEHLTAINDWAEKNGVDDANREAMYTKDYLTNLDLAFVYATAMNEIYTEQKVADLVAAIEALWAEDRVILVSDKTNADDYAARLAALKEAIDKVATEAGAENDGNYDVMIREDLQTKFAAAQARIAELQEAKAAFDALMAEMNGLTVTPNQTVYDAIVDFLDDIESLRSQYDIHEGDGNYTAMVQPALNRQAELVAEYEKKTEGIVAIYGIIKKATSTMTTLNLAIGQELYNLQATASELNLTYGVTDPELTLTIKDEQGVEQQVVLKALLDEYYALVARYQALASEAQDAAATLAGTITDALGLSNKDLKSLARIQAAVEAMQAWIEEYLTVAGDKTVEQALAEIANISVIGGEGQTYAFLTADTYTKMIAHQAAVLAHQEEARAAWATLEATLKALTEGEWTIHTDFKTATDAYTAYENTYYAGSIPGDNPEARVYAAFTDVKDEYEAKVAEAKNDAQDIKNAIGALGDLDSITSGNATEVGEKVASIYAMIEAYKTNYGCDITTCDSCGITADEVLKLAKVKAKADYMKAYTDFTTKYAAELALEENKDVATAAAGMMTTVETTLRAATTVKQAKDIAEFVRTSIARYVEQLTAGTGA